MFRISHTICPSCSVGCGVNLITENNEIIGTYPYKRHPINEGKTCLNSRTLIKELNDGVKNPLQKGSSTFVEIDNDAAVDMVKSKIDSLNSDDIAVILYGNSTNEELEEIKSFANRKEITKIGVKSQNYPKIDIEPANYDDIENAENILIIGNILFENPLIGRRVIIAMNNGARIITIDTEDITVTSKNSDEYIQTDNISDALSGISKKLGENSVIIFTKLDSKEDFEIIKDEAQKVNAKILPVHRECNTYGALKLFDPLSDDEIEEMLEKSKIAILIGYGDLDINENVLKGIDIISISPVLTSTASKSDIILPGKNWSQKAGSFTNSIGLEQSFNIVINDPENENIEEIDLFKMF